MGLLGNGNHGSVVDAIGFLDSDVPKYAGELVSMGLLVAIGSTRDRGAISLQITYDGEWEREYFRSSDEACEWLQSAIAILRGRGVGQSAQPETAATMPPKGRMRARSAR